MARKLLLIALAVGCAQAVSSTVPLSSQIVQFHKAGGQCLAVLGPVANNALLQLGPCTGNWAAAWDDRADAMGNSQIASVDPTRKGNVPLCVNDDKRECVKGNIVHMFQCQGKSTQVHLGNHFAYNNSRIVATFCPNEMCLSVAEGGKVELNTCSGAGANGWSRTTAPAPPTPAPPVPTPPPPPLPYGKCPLPGGCPNIVFFLTDDQDQVLGASFPLTAAKAATPMPKTHKLIVDQGVTASNFYIHTPICCPSRAETLTGRYLQNVKLPPKLKECEEGYSGKDSHGGTCCMHVDEPLVNNATLARYLPVQAGYTVGMFGKVSGLPQHRRRRIQSYSLFCAVPTRPPVPE